MDLLLMNYLQAENTGDTEYLQDVKDVYDDYKITESHHIKTYDSSIIYRRVKKIKQYQSPNNIIYEASKVVEKSIIQKFKKYMNQPKINRRIESEYVYNFDELCYIIDILASFDPIHKIWFKEIPDMKNAWEVNFEELL